MAIGVAGDGWGMLASAGSQKQLQVSTVYQRLELASRRHHDSTRDDASVPSLDGKFFSVIIVGYSRFFLRNFH